MSRLASLTALTLLALAVALPCGGQSPSGVRPRAPKLLYYGWGSRDTIYLRDHWREMEAMPFDALGLNVALDRAKPSSGDGATANLLGWQSFGEVAYPPERFREHIRDLQTVPRAKLKELFLAVCIASNDQDRGFNWFDDRRWATVLTNWRSLAAIAKEGRCRGILLDVEHYDYQCELFCYRHHREQRADRPFAQYRAQARKRGRQLMQEVTRVYPDIVMPMLYGWWLYQYDVSNSGKPREEARYALLPDFLDGMLEASDPRARFVDLWEFSYGYTQRAEFLEGYHSVTNKALALTTLPDRYRAQVRCGFGLFLDNGSHWDATDLAKNHFSPEQFRASLKLALELTDEYVWVYSQTPQPYPPTALPEAYVQAIREARQ